VPFKNPTKLNPKIAFEIIRLEEKAKCNPPSKSQSWGVNFFLANENNFSA
jgi:hypothetical protein